MVIISLTGESGTGKSTLAKWLRESKGFVEVSFADPLKQCGLAMGFTQSQMYGTQQERLVINPLWGISGREFLQRFGDMGRASFPVFFPTLHVPHGSKLWIEIGLSKVKELVAQGKNVVVSDTRYKGEADALRAVGGVCVRVDRTDRPEEAKLPDHLATHSSETELRELVCDHVIEESTVELAIARMEEILTVIAPDQD